MRADRRPYFHNQNSHSDSGILCHRQNRFRAFLQQLYLANHGSCSNTLDKAFSQQPLPPCATRASWPRRWRSAARAGGYQYVPRVRPEKSVGLGNFLVQLPRPRRHCNHARSPLPLWRTGHLRLLPLSCRQSQWSPGNIITNEVLLQFMCKDGV